MARRFSPPVPVPLPAVKSIQTGYYAGNGNATGLAGQDPSSDQNSAVDIPISMVDPARTTIEIVGSSGGSNWAGSYSRANVSGGPADIQILFARLTTASNLRVASNFGFPFKFRWRVVEYN